MVSPIELMIDSACGVTEKRWMHTRENLPVRLVCTVCGKEKQVRLDESDPDGTRIIQYPCGDHKQSQNESVPRYLNDGLCEILVDWKSR